MLLLAGCQISTALTSLHCPIRSWVEVNFIDVCSFDTHRRAPRNCSRFVCWYGFHGDVLDSVYVLYSDTVRCPGNNSIILGRTDASRQNSTTTIARSMSYRYMGVMLYQALCGVRRQLTVKAIVVWNNWTRRYTPQMRENLLPVRIIRKQKTTPEDSSTDHPVCCIVGCALVLE